LRAYCVNSGGALDVGAGVLPQLERLRILAEVDADLLENGVGVVLEELETLAPEHLVVRNLAGDVRDEGVAARRAGRNLGVATARAACSR